MDWSKAPLGTLQEIVQAAEKYLDAQLTLATSADQRAATMASAFTLAGTAIIAGLITLASTDQAALHARSYLPVYLGGGLAALMFLAGALVCVLSMMPVDFWLAGNEPSNWHDDVLREEKIERMLGDQANNYQGHIEKNVMALRRNAGAFKWGAVIGVAAPFVGFLIWGLISLGRLIS